MKSGSTTLRTVDALCRSALVPRERLDELAVVAARYAVAITPLMADAIDRSDPHDPIARQFVPDARELDRATRGTRAIRSATMRSVPSTASSTAIPTACCSSSSMPARSIAGSASAARWWGRGGEGCRRRRCAAALDYIRGHPQIWEVILTGGDPLVLSARRIEDVVKKIAAIAHVKIIRVHTRVPVVAPERITPALVRALRARNKATFVVLHANHPRELTKQARAACARLIDAGIPMLAQSVLLRGVNDDVETLGALMRALVECRIKPYYLHHGDLAPGTAHLRTSIAEGQALMRALRGRYSGLCQPAYVLDIPDGYGKSPIGPNYLSEDGAVVEDFNGRRHAYPPPPRSS